jgi:hypothetical protein
MSKVKTITVDIMENNYTRKILFKWLIFGLIFLGLMYVYFVGSITFNVLARRTLENKARDLNSNISQLESVYLSKLNQIDKNFALSQGFVESSNNLFAVKSISQVAFR